MQSTLKTVPGQMLMKRQLGGYAARIHAFPEDAVSYRS